MSASTDRAHGGTKSLLVANRSRELARGDRHHVPGQSGNQLPVQPVGVGPQPGRDEQGDQRHPSHDLQGWRWHREHELQLDRQSEDARRR